MFPRGTIVDPKFQYDATAQPGAYGGTINPIHRTVFQEDVDLLNLANRVKREESVLGKFSKRYHWPHLNNDRPTKPFGIA